MGKTLFVRDILEVRGEEFGVRKMEELHPGIYFVDMDGVLHFTAKESRPAVTKVSFSVRAKGAYFSIPLALLRRFEPVKVSFNPRKSSLRVEVHSININGRGFTTVDTYISDPSAAELMLSF